MTARAAQRELSFTVAAYERVRPVRARAVHDRRSNRMLPWSPAFRRSYERTAHELAPGVVDYDGLLLDGWMIVEDDLA